MKAITITCVGLFIATIASTGTVRSNQDTEPAHKPNANAANRVEEAMLLDKIDPLLHDYEGTQEVIVCLLDEQGIVPREYNIMTQVLKDLPAEKYLGDVGPDCFVADLTQEEVFRLAGHPRVQGLGSNVPRFHTLLEDVIHIVHAVEAWEIEVAGIPLTGAGQTIAIIDTGIDFSHPDLAGRNIVGCNINCLQPGIDPCLVDCDITDCNGHGTHVGGCAAASGGISGIAPGVSLVALKVFEECSSGGVTPVDIRRAINWAVDNSEQYNISVISISIGYFIIYTEGHCDGINAFITIFNGINLALEVGIGTVIAAGNGGSSEGIDAPACLSNAIPVAATNKDDTVAVYSNYNGVVKLFAPGTSINSTCAADTNCDNGIYDHKSGTSMSTPMVAAAIAILRQFLDAIGESETLDPFELEEILFQTGDPIIGLPPESWTRINIQAAVQRLIDDLVTPGDLNLDGVISTNDLLLLFANWGPCSDCNNCPADLDGDCSVSTSDLLMLFANWG